MKSICSSSYQKYPPDIFPLIFIFFYLQGTVPSVGQSFTVCVRIGAARQFPEFLVGKEHFEKLSNSAFNLEEVYQKGFCGKDGRVDRICVSLELPVPQFSLPILFSLLCLFPSPPRPIFLFAPPFSHLASLLLSTHFFIFLSVFAGILDRIQGHPPRRLHSVGLAAHGVGGFETGCQPAR